MTILGISAFYHDSAAAIIQNGTILAAAQEERFTRKKQDPDFPIHACRFCLERAQIHIDDLDAVVFYDKPFLKFERLLETYYRFAPKGILSFLKAMPTWLGRKVFLKQVIRKALAEVEPYDKQGLKILFTEHHLAHAASAFFASPFEKAAILTIDGVGEWATTSIAIGDGNKIKTLRELHFPHSPGLLYAAFTYFLGFQVNRGEYKLMGLAPYGNSKSERVRQFRESIHEYLIDLRPDGSLWLNQKYFDYATGLRMVKDRKWEKLFGFPRRPADAPIQQQHCDLALAIQQVIESVVLKLAKETLRLTNMNRLCMAGGVALNCVANGKLLRANYCEELFVQPASGDAGGAIGAALATYFIYGNKPRVVRDKVDLMQGAYLGPSYSGANIRKIAVDKNAPFEYVEGFENLCTIISEKIEAGKVVGWFQGRMEFGPRALGNRSILADPASDQMQRILNLKIKNRESFRPFAPVVLEEDVQDFFDLKTTSSYMLLVAPVQEQLRKNLPDDYNTLSPQERLGFSHSEIPAVTHVDFSARIQTVGAEDNPRFYQLLQAYKRQSGRGLLINTSFNVKDEPIVCSPEDAYTCFMKTEMDFLVMDHFIFDKTQQPKWNS